MAHLQPLPPLKGALGPSKSNQESKDMSDNSLVESISEHIEIISDGSDDDDEISKHDPINTAQLDKRRLLFGIDDEDVAPRFNINNDNLDNLLSGDNIAQHFKTATRDDVDNSENEQSHSPVSGGSETSVLSKQSDNEQHRTNSDHEENQNIDNPEQTDQEDDVILFNDNEISIKTLKKMQKQNLASDSNQNTTSDVSELINENTDEPISVNDIESPEEQDDSDDNREQTKTKHSEGAPKTLDLSENLKNSDQQPSFELSEKISVNSKHSISDKAAIRDIIIDAINKVPMQIDGYDDDDDDDGGDNDNGDDEDEDDNDDDNNDDDSLEDEPEQEINAIINEAIDNLQIKQCIRISRDSLSEIPEDDEELTIEILEETENPSDINNMSELKNSQPVPSNDVDVHMTSKSDKDVGETANNDTIISLLSVANESLDTTQNDEATRIQSGADRSFETELNANLVHMQNKIKELHDLAAGKSINMPMTPLILNTGGSNSRRDSLKDQPQSGRDSTSIATNSTEYRTFQEEYANLNKISELHLAIMERDRIIEQLTESLKQSLHIRDQLHDQSEKLSIEVNEVRKQFTNTIENLNNTSRQRNWPGNENAADTTGQRLSEITLDLVSGSEYEDDDFYAKNKNTSHGVSQERLAKIPSISDKSPENSPHYAQLELFKSDLSLDELQLFATVEAKFNSHLQRELDAVSKNYEREMLNEKTEKETEINRLKHMISNVKGGSTEVKELRQELDSIHKKEMEDLRMYFERKCSDLEKQYSEEVFSQHSRRHSNDTNSDLSDAEVFADDFISNNIKRKSKAGEILASPTHRKITPTNLGEILSPTRRIIKMTSRSATPSSNDGKNDGKDMEMNADELHEFYRKKIAHLNRCIEENLKQMRAKEQRYDGRTTDDDYMLTHSSNYDALTKDKCVDNIENNELFAELVHQYDRRLEEQVQLARADMLQELEAHINTLLSETTAEENSWPPELILLREKFTAKSQLEIAQLQIKHEEEMSRLKVDLQKQINRKQQRHSNFDDGRDFEKCFAERDNLRELCGTFRHLLYELAKCVSACENDLNATLLDELNRYGIIGNPESDSRPASPSNDDSNVNIPENDLNQSTGSSVYTINNRSLRVAVVPDVSGIISLIEDPMLVSFCAEKYSENGENNDQQQFNLNDCLERLKIEADSLLQLSEKLVSKKYSSSGEKQDCFEEEDGLKRNILDKLDSNLTYSNVLEEKFLQLNSTKQRLSLPLFVPSSGSELNVQLNDLKNRLVISERKRQELEQKLSNSMSEQNQLSEALRNAKDKYNHHIDGQKEDLSEGYGISQLESPQRKPLMATTFTTLQERSKEFSDMAPNSAGENATRMLQLIEDFCRVGDKLIEEEKQAKKDLQVQIDAADKKRKADEQFMYQQAAEREQEREESAKEIERLNLQLRNKDKDRHVHDQLIKETESLEQQIKEQANAIATHKANNSKLEADLKESIDRIYELRTIIVELESQIDVKNTSENVLTEKLNALEVYMHDQTTANESLQHEVESLKTEVTPAYEDKIMRLEEQIQSLQLTNDQTLILDRITNQLRDIEENIDRKTRKLEDAHISGGTATTCSSPSEDVSVKGGDTNVEFISPRNSKYLAFPIELIQRITDKLAKHTRTEEATIKHIRDLEMQIKNTLETFNEIQNERDVLQEKVSEQNLRISTLQSRLDEQRQRAEELQRAGTSNLNMKLYDVQNELKTLQETLTSREKQITVLKNHLAQSKEIIDRQEIEISQTSTVSSDQRISKLEEEIITKDAEIKTLKEKIRTEMINKLALPDLMETMLADKNEEIDYLKEQLAMKEKELAKYRSGAVGFRSEFSSIKETDELECVRRAENLSGTAVSLPLFGMDSAKYFTNTSKDNIIELTEEPTTSLKMLSDDGLFTTFADIPQIPSGQINFSPKSNADTDADTLHPSPSVKNTKETSVNDILKLEAEIINLKSILEDKRDLVEQIATENGNLKVRLAEYEVRQTELLVEKKRLEEEIQSLLELNDRLKTMELRLSEKDEEAATFEKKYMDKCNQYDAFQVKFKENLADVEIYKQQLESLNNVISNKDELLSKYEKDMLNYAQHEKQHMEMIGKLQDDNRELEAMAKLFTDTKEDYSNLKIEFSRLKDALGQTEADLTEKMVAYEKCLLDIEEHERTIYHLNDVLVDSKTARSVEEMRIEMRQLQERNEELTDELKLMKRRLRSEHSASPRPSIDEITSRVEKELNYSAQLDSSILKAIESDEINSENEQEKEEIRSERDRLETSVKMLQDKCEKLQDSIVKERQGFTATREQDANCIETISKRLEATLVQESELNRLLEEERRRSSQLMEQLTEQQLQRSTITSSDIGFFNTPKGSPRRLLRGGELDGDVVKRLNEEIKLLKSQSEREKERSDDLERVVLREKNRFEKELRDRKEYGDNMKQELDDKLQENQALQSELQQAQDRLTISLMDIENFQIRIKSLQDAELYRAARLEKERSELTQTSMLMQELKEKQLATEKERDVLLDRVKVLQLDIERGTQREARLTESLAGVAGYNAKNILSSNHLVFPQQMLGKLKEMNEKLGDNVRENRQLSDTLQFLTNERQMLQKRVIELEQTCIDKEDLEERANHLFGKYLRTESFRRALVHQKRYLLIVLGTYEANEAKVLSMVNGVFTHAKKRKRPSFKAVVLVAIAIERMKFILRRWHTGKRVCAKGIFAHSSPIRRTMSVSTISNINWSRGNVPNNPQSPPSRDRANLLQGKRLSYTLSSERQ